MGLTPVEIAILDAAANIDAMDGHQRQRFDVDIPEQFEMTVWSFLSQLRDIVQTREAIERHPRFCKRALRIMAHRHHQVTHSIYLVAD